MDKSEVLTRYSVLIVELVASCSRLSFIREKLPLIVLTVIFLFRIFYNHMESSTHFYSFQKYLKSIILYRQGTAENPERKLWEAL